MNPERDRTPEDRRRDSSDWKHTLSALIASRLEIIQLEMRQAAREGARTVAAIVAAALCAFFTWALVLAGGIAYIAQATQWPWPLIALIAASLHLMAGFVLLRAAKASKAPSFPVTRSEFQKDREWIESLQNKPDSRN